MGGLCKSTTVNVPSSSESVQTNEIPDWVSSAGQNLFQRADELSRSPYPAYTGPRMPTYGGDRRTEEERQGADILVNGAESYLPYINRANEVADTLGQGYGSATREELLGDPYQGASRDELLGNYNGASREDLLGNYEGAGRDELLGNYDGAGRDELLGNYEGPSREELLGNYEGATRDELLGDYQGATREELLGDPFSLENSQEYMDIYQSALDPAVREIERQTMNTQNDARARAAAGGGGFGSRLALLESRASGEGAQAAGDLRARGAREGLGFAANRYDTDRAARSSTEQQMRSGAEADRAARFGAENTMRNQFMGDQASRLGVEDRMRNQFQDDRANRFGAENLARGQFMEDQAGRFGAENLARGQFQDDRANRFGAENTMRNQFMGDQAGRFNAENLMRGQYDTDRNARFSAEDSARAGYQTEEAARNQQMNAYRSMAPMVQNLQQNAAQGLIGVGEGRRRLDQQGLDLAYSDYLDQRQYPQEMINFSLGALRGTPYNTTSRGYNTSMQQRQGPSVYGQALAGLGQAYSGYQMGRR